MPAAIEAEGLTKQYGRITAVDDLQIQVEQGEIFGFVGPNGAGKSTTMRMLLGLVRPTSGFAVVLGLDLREQLPAVLSRTGSLIENPTFYPFLSGFDNLRMVAKIVEAPEAAIPGLLDLVDLSKDARRKFKTYSLGMKQRLAVASCMLGEPELLILDEPANGLDPAGIVEMRRLLQRLKEQGKTIFISSHVLHEIEQVCDRIAILNKGRLVVEGRVDDLLQAGGQIEIRIDRPQEAQSALNRIDWIREVSRDGTRLLIRAPVQRAAEVNAILAQEGLFASEIRPYDQSLEQYFLSVTEEAKS